MYNESSYDPYMWYWVIGDDSTRAWSSAMGDYVTSWPADRVTRIASEAELTDVLRPYGLVLPAPTLEDYAAAIQKHLDAVAAARQYDGADRLCTYAQSAVTAWKNDAANFITWRDQVWQYVFTQQAAVLSGARAQPSIQTLLAELPSITWNT